MDPAQAKIEAVARGIAKLVARQVAQDFCEGVVREAASKAPITPATDNCATEDPTARSAASSRSKHNERGHAGRNGRSCTHDSGTDPKDQRK